MSRRVVVTGLGLVTPLGVGVSSSWSRLLAGESGVSRTTSPESNHDVVPASSSTERAAARLKLWSSLPSRVAAFVPRGKANENKFQLDKFEPNEIRSMSVGMMFGLVAAREALEDAQLVGGADPARVGVTVGMAMVDLDYIAECHQLVASGQYKKVGPYFVPRILPNLAPAHIAIKFGLRGPNHSVSTACATGAHAIGDAFRLIQSGSAEAMVCGGAEACITPLAVAGFCRARALSTQFNDDPTKASRPFDRRRDGFVIGEGAGILVLEELEHALRRGAKKIYGEMLGYGLSGDADHITAGREDGEGALQAMQDALCQALPHVSSNCRLWHVNAHATSTPRGDAAEIVAIRKLVESVNRSHANLDVSRVLVSSNKGHIGHLLGAAGSVESAFSLIGLRQGVVPATANVEDLDPALNVSDDDNVRIVYKDSHVEKEESAGSKIVLKNSFGFGGTNVSLIFGQSPV